MTNETDIALPALGGITHEAPIPRLIRSLTHPDHLELERSRLVYSLAAPQMRMFGVLVRNFQVLQSFASSFEASRLEGVDVLLEMDRHILNYLASASAVLDHFGRAFKKRTRAISKPDDGFSKFIDELKGTDDAFQFFCEFRNYALHSSLPVGNLSEGENLEMGRTVRITHSSKELLKDGRGDLRSCRILKSMDEIELVPLLSSFHETMMGKVFQWVVECVMPGLVPAQRYHAALAEEVKKTDPALQPVIVTKKTVSGNQFQWQLQYIPDDIFNELGIRVTKRKPNKANALDAPSSPR